ncbi:MAG TPA: sensor histidine kinase [Thermoanaerobaculia bacterium]|nr:sensor histidine kinase [Thermoanaerobaculia bacterium]
MRNLRLLGYLTWALVAIPTLRSELHAGGVSPRFWLGASTLLGFCVLFWVATWSSLGKSARILVVSAESAVALLSVFLHPNGFVPVLLVIVAVQLGHLSFAQSIPVLAAQSVALALVYLRTDSDSFVLITLAYVAFQLLALLTTHSAISETAARQELAAANAELRVTSGLLEMSSRTSERLRIARDLHDLLGHHLTALSLNLEVASHQAEGEALRSIERSKSITKLLLSDVREVVGSLREDEPLDLASALQSVRDVIVSPVMHLDIAAGMAVTDPKLAQTVLRAVQEIVTNAVRHSEARNLWITLEVRDQRLKLGARDDGNGTDDLRFGNGLRGIQERVAEAGGELEVSSTRGKGLSMKIQLPLHEEPA